MLRWVGVCLCFPLFLFGSSAIARDDSSLFDKLPEHFWAERELILTPAHRDAAMAVKDSTARDRVKRIQGGVNSLEEFLRSPTLGANNIQTRLARYQYAKLLIFIGNNLAREHIRDQSFRAQVDGYYKKGVKELAELVKATFPCGADVSTNTLAVDQFVEAAFIFAGHAAAGDDPAARKLRTTLLVDALRCHRATFGNLTRQYQLWRRLLDSTDEKEGVARDFLTAAAATGSARVLLEARLVLADVLLKGGNQTQELLQLADAAAPALRTLVDRDVAEGTSFASELTVDEQAIGVNTIREVYEKSGQPDKELEQRDLLLRGMARHLGFTQAQRDAGFYLLLLDAKFRNRTVYLEALRSSGKLNCSTNQWPEACIAQTVGVALSWGGEYAAATEFLRDRISFLESGRAPAVTVTEAMLDLAEVDWLRGAISASERGLAQIDKLASDGTALPEDLLDRTATLRSVIGYAQLDDRPLVDLLETAAKPRKNGRKRAGADNNNQQSGAGGSTRGGVLLVSLVDQIRRILDRPPCAQCDRTTLRAARGALLQTLSAGGGADPEELLLAIGSPQFSFTQAELQRFIKKFNDAKASEWSYHPAVLKLVRSRLGQTASEVEVGRLLALLHLAGGFELLSAGDPNDPSSIASQLLTFFLSRDYQVKKTMAADVLNRVHQSEAGQFAADAPGYEKIFSLAKHLQNLGYKSEARAVLEALMGLEPDAAVRTAMATTFVPALAQLAASETGAKEYASALGRLDEAMAMANARLTREWRMGNQRTILLLNDLRTSLRLIAETRLRIVTQASHLLSPKGQDSAFRDVQMVALSEVALALQASARRRISASPKLAGVFDRLDEAELAIEQLSSLRNEWLPTLPGVSRELSRQRTIKDEASAVIKKELPGFADGATLKPVTLSEAQSLLRDDEAIVQYVALPGSEEAFALAVTKSRFQLVRLALSPAALGEKVRALRCGLDEEEWEVLERATTCAKLLGVAKRSSSEPLPFHLGVGHELYRTLLVPFEGIIERKKLLVVLSGALTSLPLHVLLTQSYADAMPKSYEGYRGLAWLSRSHEITVIAGVASLWTLRNLPSATPTIKYLAYGNPLFEGKCGASLPADMTCPAVAVAGANAPRSTAAGPVLRGKLMRRSPNPGSLALGRDANASAIGAAVRGLCALPDTAYELECVAESLGAKKSEIRLGQAASEADIKKLSRSGELEKYEIIHFATHGLLAGEVELWLRRRGEPGIALSPPNTLADAENDGLLTASEIAQLRMNANWVVLSACNTASGSDSGAEALSGLARAFFDAGARALLVSHWPVYSRAAVQLVSRTFAALQAEPGISRAGALARAMEALMQDPSDTRQAHPSFWAPFVLVGGGR